MFAIGFGLFVVALVWLFLEIYYRRVGIDISTECGDMVQFIMLVNGFFLLLAGVVAWLYRVMP